ncbi:MAG TPA: acetylxylan esterase, partial [Cyclobacteriaceae bacterium]|nr:acetylxylan esterase [Cyclobacteriaceae bacterium]
MQKTFLLLVVLAIHSTGSAQFLSQAARDSIAKLSAVDHEQMKKQIGITVPNRPGPSGNPTAPNAANRFEDKVNKYT